MNNYHANRFQIFFEENQYTNLKNYLYNYNLRKMAVEKKLRALSITDHDAIRGIKPAFDEEEFFYSKEFRKMLKIDEDSLSIFYEELGSLFNRREA